MGYRGLPNCTQFFLEGALSDWATALRVVLDPSRPTQLFSPEAAFTQDLVGRLVRVPGWGLYRVGGPEDVSVAPFRYEILELVEVATASWSVPNWATLTAPTEVEVEFLAFHVREDQAGPSAQTLGDTSGTATVYLYPEVVDDLPWTFAYEHVELEVDPPSEGETEPVPIDPQPSEPWPEEMPSAGFVVADGDVVDLPEGTYPAFALADELLFELRDAWRNIVVAGAKLRFVRFPQLIPEAGP